MQLDPKLRLIRIAEARRDKLPWHRRFPIAPTAPYLSLFRMAFHEACGKEVPYNWRLAHELEFGHLPDIDRLFSRTAEAREELWTLKDNYLTDVIHGCWARTVNKICNQS